MKWVCLLMILPAVALGGSRGSITGNRFRADFVAPAQMSLKVMSPRGATVEIRANNKLLAKGTIPFVYTPAEEGFVSVSVILPSGKRWWGNSLRMKAKTGCELYVMEPPGDAVPAAQSGPARAEGQAGAEPASVVEPPQAGAVAPTDSSSSGDAPAPADPGKATTPSPQDEVPSPAATTSSGQP